MVAEVIPDLTAHGDFDVERDKWVVAAKVRFQSRVRACWDNYAVEAASRPTFFRGGIFLWMMCINSALVNCTGRGHGRSFISQRLSHAYFSAAACFIS